MNKSLVIAALLAATAAASPSIPGAAFAAGMGGGGSSGMGGASGGGMGGGGTGIGGASGMGGGRGIAGGMFRSPAADFDRPAATPGDNSGSADNYTYQCVTTFGRCSFVAPAMLRANSLRSGAECSCSGGQVKGRVE